MLIKKILIQVLIFLSLIIPYSSVAYSGTVISASCSYSDVQSAINSANSGDTVYVPECTASWSKGITINKGITLQGAGVEKTIIKYTGLGKEAIINYNPSIPFNNEYFRLTGFSIDCNNISETVGILIKNTSNEYIITNIRVDHNRIVKAGSYAAKFLGMIYGLFDNNELEGNYIDFNILGNDKYSWNDPLKIGSSRYLYIESNKITNTREMIILSGWGARWVFRYNTVDLSEIGYNVIDAHGNLVVSYPECNWENDIRGVVGHEIYENIFTNLNRVSRLHDHRGGTGIIFNNIVTGMIYGGNSTIVIREEDNNSGIGACYPVKNTYPGYDPVKDTYIWNNTLNGIPYYIYNEDSDFMIIEKRDYWSDTQAGTPNPTNYWIKGSSSNRGSFCENGNIYWETDKKRLYKCIGENNWTLIYMPYTYPHPLSLSQSAPSPPKNLKISN